MYGEKGQRLKTITHEIREFGHFPELEMSTSMFLEYCDSLSFAVLFAEEVDYKFHFGYLLRRNPALRPQIEKVKDAINGWYREHEDEPALEGSIDNTRADQKRAKLLSYLLDLLRSYTYLGEQENVDQGRFDGTISNIEATISILKRQ